MKNQKFSKTIHSYVKKHHRKYVLWTWIWFLALKLIMLIAWWFWLIDNFTKAEWNGWTWNNDVFIDQTFWAQWTNDQQIKEALFGVNTWDKTAYTEARSWNDCDIDNMTVEYKYPWTDSIPQQLSSNTIYVLNPWNYKITYNDWIWMSGCNAIIWSGDITFYSTNTLSSYAMFYLSWTQNNIIDNINIDGESNWNLGIHSKNDYWMRLVNTTNAVVNHVEVYNNFYVWIHYSNSNMNIVNNSKFYNNYYWILFYLSTNNTINNSQSFNNLLQWMLFSFSTWNVVNNSQSYSNYQYGIIFNTSNNNIVNNSQAYNNSWMAWLGFFDAYGNIINESQSYNNLWWIYAFTTEGPHSDILYYGNLLIFKNDDFIVGGPIMTAWSHSDITGSNMWWQNWLIVTGNQQLWDYINNPISAGGKYLLPRWEALVGLIWPQKTFTGLTVGYSYGENIPTQKQPVYYRGDSILTSQVFDNTKYIWSDIVKNVWSMLWIPDTTTNAWQTINITCPADASTYEILWDIVDNKIWSCTDTTTWITLSAWEWPKTIIVQFNNTTWSDGSHIASSMRFMAPSTTSRENNNFIDESFWNLWPASEDIINALYGTDITDKTAYTENRSGNNCEPANMNIVYKTWGLNTIPQNLSGNTIYVLNPWDYRISYTNWINLSGNCIGLVWYGTGNITLYSVDHILGSASAADTAYWMINIVQKRFTILDNIKIDGESNWSWGNHTSNTHWVKYYKETSYNTINNIETYNNEMWINFITISDIDGVCTWWISVYNTLNNVLSYDNIHDWISLMCARYNTINNSDIFNNYGNGGNGISIQEKSEYNVINNAKIYNNGAWLRIDSYYNAINNSQIFSNRDAGIVYYRDVLLNNSQLYDNNMTFENFNTKKIITNNVIIQSAYAEATLQLGVWYYYGNLILEWQNFEPTTWQSSDVIAQQLWWTTWNHIVSNSLSSPDYRTNPVNWLWNYFFNRKPFAGYYMARNFSVVGHINYSYGSGILLQAQPVRHNGTTWVTWWNFDPSKYIWSNTVKVNWSILWLSNNMTASNWTLTGLWNSPVTQYSLFWDIINYISWQNINTATWIIFSWWNGTKNIIVQLYWPTPYFATHFETTGNLNSTSDTTSPIVSTSYIYSGTTWYANSNYYYKWTVDIRANVSDNVLLDGVGCKYTTDTNRYFANYQWSFTTWYCFMTSITGWSDLNINFSTKDAAGNQWTWTTRNYIYDATPPSQVSLSLPTSWTTLSTWTVALVRSTGIDAWIWISGYIYQISTWATFTNIKKSGTAFSTWVTVAWLTSNTYYRRVYAFDKLWNTWSRSSVSNFVTESTVIAGIWWENDNFIDESFWALSPTSWDIKNALYGTDLNDITAYTKNRSGTACNISLITVEYKNPWINSIPQKLSGNTIYVLNSGNYRIGYKSWVELNGNCIWLIWSGNVNFYSTGKINSWQYNYRDWRLWWMLNIIQRSFTIIDNVKIDWTWDGFWWYHPDNAFGIKYYKANSNTVNNSHIYNHPLAHWIAIIPDSDLNGEWADPCTWWNSDYNMINNIKAYNNRYGITLCSAHHTLIENSDLFNMNRGIQIWFKSNYNTINNIKAYNNSSVGIAIVEWYNAINNSVLFGNYYWMWSLAPDTTKINNSQFYNNNYFQPTFLIGPILSGTIITSITGNNIEHVESYDNDREKTINPIDINWQAFFSWNGYIKNPLYIAEAIPRTYSYWSWIFTQIQPIRHNWTNWEYTWTYDDSKYIGSNNTKLTWDIQWLSSSINSIHINLTWISNSPIITNYSILGDLNPIMTWIAIGTKASVLLTPTRGTKTLIFQLYNQNEYVLNHFVKTVLLDVPEISIQSYISSGEIRNVVGYLWSLSFFYKPQIDIRADISNLVSWISWASCQYTLDGQTRQPANYSGSNNTWYCFKTWINTTWNIIVNFKIQDLYNNYIVGIWRHYNYGWITQVGQSNVLSGNYVNNNGVYYVKKDYLWFDIKAHVYNTGGLNTWSCKYTTDTDLSYTYLNWAQNRTQAYYSGSSTSWFCYAPFVLWYNWSWSSYPSTRKVSFSIKDLAQQLSFATYNTYQEDGTPPSGWSISINNGDQTTTMTWVTLNIICPIDTGAWWVEILYNNISSTSTNVWTACNSTMTVPRVLTWNQGNNIVYMYTRDVWGNLNPVAYADGILIPDSIPPVVSTWYVQSSSAAIWILSTPYYYNPVYSTVNVEAYVTDNVWISWATCEYTVDNGASRGAAWYRHTVWETGWYCYMNGVAATDLNIIFRVKDTYGNLSTWNLWFYIKDANYPTWWSFKINNGASTTTTTWVILNVVCPTDGTGVWWVKVGVTNTGGSSSYINNWIDCNSMLIIPWDLSPWTWTKTVWMIVKDLLNNVVWKSDTISLPYYMPDDVPYLFTFMNKTWAELNTLYTSNIITITWMSEWVFTWISVNSWYMIKSGVNIGQSWTGWNGDQFILALTSSNNYETYVSGYMIIGGVSSTFAITTKNYSEDYTPDQFLFINKTGYLVDTIYTSNIVIITWMSPWLFTWLSVNTWYIIKNWENIWTWGTWGNGDQIILALTSSHVRYTWVNTILNIGWSTGNWRLWTPWPIMVIWTGIINESESTWIVYISTRNIYDISDAMISLSYDQNIVRPIAVKWESGLPWMINPSFMSWKLVISWSTSPAITRPDNTPFISITFLKIGSGKSSIDMYPGCAWTYDCYWWDKNYLENFPNVQDVISWQIVSYLSWTIPNISNWYLYSWIILKWEVDDTHNYYKWSVSIKSDVSDATWISWTSCSLTKHNNYNIITRENASYTWNSLSGYCYKSFSSEDLSVLFRVKNNSNNLSVWLLPYDLIYDSVWPSKVNLSYPTSWTNLTNWNISLSWLKSYDTHNSHSDSEIYYFPSYWVWTSWYYYQISTWESFVNNVISWYAINTWININLSNAWTYYWRVYSYDRLWNTWTWSDVYNFQISGSLWSDTTPPNVSNWYIYNGTTWNNWSTLYYKWNVDIRAFVSDAVALNIISSCAYTTGSGRYPSNYNGTSRMGYCEKTNIAWWSDLNINFRVKDTSNNLWTWTATTYIYDNIWPSKVVLQSPSYWAAVSTGTVALSWNASVDTWVGISGYYYQISASYNFDTILQSGFSISTWVIFSGFSTSQIRWRVYALDKLSNTWSWSDTWIFMTSGYSHYAPVSIIWTGVISTWATSIVIPVRVWNNFNNINNADLRLRYDPTIVTAVMVSSIGLWQQYSNLSYGITVPWDILISRYTIGGLSLPNNGVMFNITFSKVWSGVSPIWFDDADGYDCRRGDANYLNVWDLPYENYYISGYVISQVSESSPIVSSGYISNASTIQYGGTYYFKWTTGINLRANVSDADGISGTTCEYSLNNWATRSTANYNWNSNSWYCYKDNLTFTGSMTMAFRVKDIYANQWVWIPRYSVTDNYWPTCSNSHDHDHYFFTSDVTVTITWADWGAWLANIYYCFADSWSTCTPDITGALTMINPRVATTTATIACEQWNFCQKHVVHRSVDILWNVEASKSSHMVTIDKQWPQNMSFDINNWATYTTWVNIALTNITWFDQWTPMTMSYWTSANASQWRDFASPKWWVLDWEDWLKTLYVRLKDAGWNISTISRTITLDRSLPVITIYNPNTNPEQSKTISWSTNEWILYQVVTNWTTCDWTLTFSTYQTLTFSSESNNGNKVCYKAVDSVWNASYSMSNPIQWMDRTSPTITIVSPSTNVWTSWALLSINTNENAECRYSSTAWVNFTSMALLNWILTSHTWNYTAIEWVNNIYFKCKDVAGNISNDTQHTFTLDSINPIAQFIISTLPSAITNNNTVNISITWTNLSAYKYKLINSNSCAWIIYDWLTGSLTTPISQWPSSSDQNYSYCIIWYNSIAWRSLTWNKYTFIYDNTAPVITVNDWLNSNRNTWDNINISVDYNIAWVVDTKYILSTSPTCNASVNFSSAINYTPWTNILINSEIYNGQYLCFKSSDTAWNIGYAWIWPIRVDTTAPIYIWNTPISSTRYKSWSTVSIDVSLTETGAWIPMWASCNIKLDWATAGFTQSTVVYDLGTNKCTWTLKPQNSLSDWLHNITIQVTDMLWNSIASTNKLINFDNNWPAIALISPINWASTNSSTSVSFSRNGIDNGVWISGYTFRLYTSGTTLITWINLTWTNMVVSNLLNWIYSRSVESTDSLWNTWISNIQTFSNMTNYVILPSTVSLSEFISAFTNRWYLLWTGSKLFETWTLSWLIIGSNDIFFWNNNEIKSPVIMWSTWTIDKIEIKIDSWTFITKTGTNASGCESFLFTPRFVLNNTTGNLVADQNILSTFRIWSSCDNVSIRFLNNSWSTRNINVRIRDRNLSDGEYNIWYSENGIDRDILWISDYSNNMLEFSTNHMTYFAITQDKENLLESLLSFLWGGGSTKLTKDNCKYSSTKNNLQWANTEWVDYSPSYYDKDCWTSDHYNDMILDWSIEWSHYWDELNNAYLYAYRAWITTIPDINRADMMWKLLRKHMAKMISNYAINILWKVPDDSVECNFVDMDYEDSEMQEYAKLVCQLGLMWLNANWTPSEKFYPWWLVTRSQFGTALSRLLYWDAHNASAGQNRYGEHLAALKDNDIMQQITNPNMFEKRWYVMLMLMRAWIY